MRNGNAARVSLMLFIAALAMSMFWSTVSPVWAAGNTSSSDSASSDSEGMMQPLVRAQLDQLDTEKIESFWRKVMGEYGGYLPEVKGEGIILLMSGDGGLSLKAVWQGMLRFFFDELLINGKLLGTIIIITVFAMILETIQAAFERNSVSMVAYAISYMVLIIIAVNSFYVAIGYAKEAISMMVDFMLALIPLVLALLAVSGNIASVAMFHPLIIFMVNISGTLIYTIIFPLLFLSAILYIVSSFSERYKVTQLARLLRNVSISILGIFLTSFLAVISVQGATTAVADGITVRTAKYITSNFVPIVGRMFADATDTVMGASLLVKNTIGLAGVVILLMICIFPAVKILTLAFIYNLSSAVMQPLGNSPIIECLSIIGKNLILIFAALATVGLMFFLAVTIIITAGNISVMVR